MFIEPAGSAFEGITTSEAVFLFGSRTAMIVAAGDHSIDVPFELTVGLRKSLAASSCM